jgi:hypothetical protein
VEEVGGDDGDGGDVVAGEKLAVVGRHEGAVVLIGATAGERFVKVADASEAREGVRRIRHQVGLAPHAQSDHTEADGFRQENDLLTEQGHYRGGFRGASTKRKAKEGKGKGIRRDAEGRGVQGVGIDEG